MAGARYWRVYGLDAYGGGDLSLSELGLYEAGVRVDTSAMLTATVAPTSGDVSALSDGSTAIDCTWSRLRYGMSSFSFVYDLGTPREVDEIRLSTATDHASFPYRFSVQSSEDGSTWDGAATLKGVVWLGQGAMASVFGPWVSLPSSALLLGLNGPDGSTSIRDSGELVAPIAVNGNVHISAAQSKFGYGSAYFDGNWDSLVIPSAFTLKGAQDYTVAVWSWIAGYPTSSVAVIFSQGDGGNSINFEITPAGQLGIFLRPRDSYDATPAGVVPIGEWFHTAVTRQSGVTKVYLNGGKVLENTFMRTIPANAMYIGANLGGEIRFFNGYMQDFVCTPGYALWSSDFTPPGPLASPVGTSANSMPAIRGNQDFTPQLSSPYPMPSFGINYSPMPKANHRLDFQGDGMVAGNVKRKGDPDNIPLRRKVLCMDMLTSTVVDETWSDAITGEYTFLCLDRSRRYTVLSYDHTRAYRAAIADQLTPEKM